MRCNHRWRRPSHHGRREESCRPMASAIAILTRRTTENQIHQQGGGLPLTSTCENHLHMIPKCPFKPQIPQTSIATVESSTTTHSKNFGALFNLAPSAAMDSASCPSEPHVKRTQGRTSITQFRRYLGGRNTDGHGVLGIACIHGKRCRHHRHCHSPFLRRPWPEWRHVSKRLHLCRTACQEVVPYKAHLQSTDKY